MRGKILLAQLDEVYGAEYPAGRDIHVVDRQLVTTTGLGSVVFELGLWVAGFIPAIIATVVGTRWPALLAVLWIAGFAPGLIFLLLKQKARNYFQALQQRIQAAASEIDNYLEQRVIVLQNLVPLVNRAIDLDKDVMKTVTAYRSGIVLGDGNRNEVNNNLDRAFGQIMPRVENYPDLKAHRAIAEAMAQNSYLQREITAARSLYNDTVAIWNADIFQWPTKQMVAAQAGLSTRIPFTASAEIKTQARQVFF